MNVSGNIFGGKEEMKPTTHELMQKLRDTENLLINKQDLLEQKIGVIMLSVRKHGTKNMTDAVAAFKLKKRYERHLTRFDGMLTQVEILREALEGTSKDPEFVSHVLEVLHEANDMLFKHNDIDNVEFSDDEFDEDELEKEIEYLEQGSDSCLLDNNETKPVKATLNDEDEEFKKLESWAS
ncbi:charged multivesicular body protein 4b-like [Aphomia sociella]